MDDSIELQVVTVLPEPPAAELLFQAAASIEEHVLGDLASRFNTEIDIRNQQGQTALHLALQSHDQRAVKALVEHGANIEVMDFHGRRPLTIAVQEFLLDSARFLLDHGAATETDNDNYNYGHTPLHEAAGLGNLEMVRLLLVYGADIHALSIRGRHPLFYAVEGRHSHVVKLLLERNADPDARSSGEPPTALHLTAENGDIETMRALLEGGAQVDPRDFDGATPLFQTVTSGNIEGTKILLQHGASVRIWRSDRQSVFDLADGNKEMLELLKADRVLRGPRIRDPKGGGDGGVDSTILKPPRLPAENNENVMTACMGFDATIINFFTSGDHEEYIPKTASIYELLYSHGPGAIRSHLGGREPNFTWYHLPANNMTWAEGLIRRLTAEKGRVSAEVYNEMKVEMELSKRSKRSSKAASSFVTMRPLCRTVMDGRTTSHAEQDQHVLAFVPFLHFESLNGYRQLAKALDNARNQSNTTTVRHPTHPHPRPPPPVMHSSEAGGSQEHGISYSRSIVSALSTTENPPAHASKLRLASVLSFGKGIWGRLRGKSRVHDPPSDGDIERQSSSGSGSRLGSRRERTRPQEDKEAAGTARSEHNQEQQEGSPYLQKGSRDDVAIPENASSNNENAAPMLFRPPSLADSSKKLSVIAEEISEEGNGRPETSEGKEDGQGDGQVGAGLGGKVSASPDMLNNETESQDIPVKQTESFPKRTTKRRPKRRILPPTENLHEYLIKGYFHTKSSGLQPRRTLDQYLYAEIETAADRDEDQVVYRYTRDGSRGEAKIFMVDQLWLWVIGDDTVVTCCPLRWDSWLEQDERRAQTVPTSGPLRPPLYLKWLSGRVQPPQAPNLTRGMSTAMSGALGQESRRGPNRHRDPRPSVREREPDSDDWPVLNPSDPLSVSQLIDRHLRKQGRGAIKSVYEFAGLITTCCIDVFDPHQVPDEYMFLDFFERSIGRANDKAVSYLREFKEALSDLGGGVLGPDVMDITNEIELLIEVDDILDELHTLKQVLTDQKGVVSDLNKMLKEVAKDATLHPYINTRTLENHLSRIEQMRGAADKADKALHRLMDLKQKQASLSEAHYARESAIDTARQGKTVVVFTVVTIIFLPISFLAAIFSIDTNGFPRDEDDLIPFDYLLQHILTIGLAISIPLIVIAFNVDRISMWLNTLRDSLDSLWRRGTVVSVYASIFLAILVPIWTSSLENNVQVAVTVFIILFMGIHAVGSLFWRLIPVPMSTISATSGSDWRNRNSM